MKTIYLTLFLIISVILTSCGMTSNFNKRKYTNLKKSKAEIKIKSKEVSSTTAFKASLEPEENRVETVVTEDRIKKNDDVETEIEKETKISKWKENRTESSLKNKLIERKVKRKHIASQINILKSLSEPQEDPDSMDIVLKIVLIVLLSALFLFVLYVAALIFLLAALLLGSSIGILLIGATVLIIIGFVFLVMKIIRL